MARGSGTRRAEGALQYAPVPGLRDSWQRGGAGHAERYATRVGGRRSPGV
jgi:hypothetical protein